MSQTQKPIHQIRIGSVRASIWEHVTDTTSFLTVTYSRTYRDTKGEWHNVHSYAEHDIELQIDCAIEAKKFIRHYRQSHTRVA